MKPDKENIIVIKKYNIRIDKGQINKKTLWIYDIEEETEEKICSKAQYRS